MLDVAIAGGGPGGLAAAAAILRAAPSLSVAVLERSTLRPRGANVSLMPNGVHALAAIDPALAAQLLAGDATSWARKVFTAEGQLVKHQEDCNLYGVLAHGPVPSLAWHALQALLAAALPLGVLRQGTSVVGYEQDASAGCVRVCLEPGGEEMAARLLVGADGGQSCVRQQLLQDGPPTYEDTVIWRAVAPLPDWWPMDHGACFFGRPPQMFNTYTLPGRTLAWQAYCPWPADRLEEIGGRRGHYIQDELTKEKAAKERLGRVLGAYEGWADCVLRLIRATDPRTITEHPQFYREQEDCTEWTRGRVALLGDAAHLATAMLGQGTSQAIEDALELGRAIGELGPTPEALQRYQAARQPANAPVQATSVKIFKGYRAGVFPRNEMEVALEKGFVQRKFAPLVAAQDNTAAAAAGEE